MLIILQSPSTTTGRVGQRRRPCTQTFAPKHNQHRFGLGRTLLGPKKHTSTMIRIQFGTCTALNTPTLGGHNTHMKKEKESILYDQVSCLATFQQHENIWIDKYRHEMSICKMWEQRWLSMNGIPEWHKFQLFGGDNLYGALQARHRHMEIHFPLE